VEVQHRSLQKEVGLTLATSLVIGTVIGSGIFMKPGKVIEYAGDSTLALWAWIVGGLITLASGLTIAEVGTQIPKTGGLYVYLEEVYGKVWGFLAGWVQSVIYAPAVIGALGLYFGSLLVHLFGWGAAWKLPIAVGTVLLLAVVNSLGTRYGGFVQTAATLGKLVPIALIAVFGMWKGNGQIWGADSGVTTEISFGAAVLATLWAYDGWMLVGFMAGEMKNPAKVLPRAIIGGLLVVTLAYLSVNVALLHLLPASEIVRLGENAAGAAASHLFGEWGGRLISVGILVSIFGCLNGKILAFPRVPFAMAERGQLPGSRWLSRIHAAYGTPVAAIFLQAVIAVILMVVSNPDHLSELAIFSVYLFYILAFVALFILRRRQGGRPRAYSVPLYPIVPLFAIAGSLYILASTLLTNPGNTLAALAITLLGLPFFRRGQRKEAALRGEPVRANR
jgi:basic amino acid/polyamine antiporter, APA family